MSCFWDSLIKSITQDDLNTYFDQKKINIYFFSFSNVSRKTILFSYLSSE